MVDEFEDGLSGQRSTPPYGDRRQSLSPPGVRRSRTKTLFGGLLLGIGLAFFAWTVVKIVVALIDASSGADISVAYTLLIAAAFCILGGALLRLHNGKN